MSVLLLFVKHLLLTLTRTELALKTVNHAFSFGELELQLFINFTELDRDHVYYIEIYRYN